jgi:hypothetical protein
MDPVVDPEVTALRTATDRLRQAGLLAPERLEVLSRRARRRRHRRSAAVAGTAALAVVLVVALWTLPSSGPQLVSGAPPGSRAPATAWPSGPGPVLGSDLIVYLQPNATSDQIEGLRVELEARPGLHRLIYADHQAAYETFAACFRDSPEMVQSVVPEVLPTSFQVDLGGDAARTRELEVWARDKAGVRETIIATGHPRRGECDMTRYAEIITDLLSGEPNRGAGGG